MSALAKTQRKSIFNYNQIHGTHRRQQTHIIIDAVADVNKMANTNFTTATTMMMMMKKGVPGMLLPPANDWLTAALFHFAPGQAALMYL